VSSVNSAIDIWEPRRCDVLMPFVRNGPDLWEQGDRAHISRRCSMLQSRRAPNAIPRPVTKIISISSDASRSASSGDAVSRMQSRHIVSRKRWRRVRRKSPHTVNVVCPGPTDTGLAQDRDGVEKKVWTDGRVASRFAASGQHATLAGAGAIFASSDSDFVTGPGAEVRGGPTMAVTAGPVHDGI